MSANLVVDLFNTTQMTPSIVCSSGGNGTYVCSGAIIGNTVDLLYANTFCNLFISTGISQSGLLRVGVQTSDATTSGSFTDPTSGLPQLPTSFQSGGLIWFNSGGGLVSGAYTAAGFQRPHRYARCIALSGDFFNGPIQAGFVSQLKTTGSGGGYTWVPQSGTTLNV